jgi:hypothetical protein
MDGLPDDLVGLLQLREVVQLFLPRELVRLQIRQELFVFLLDLPPPSDRTQWGKKN